MSDRRKKLNNDDLAQYRSLIGEADGSDFSLDDILAEYGSGRTTGRGAVPVSHGEEPQPAQEDPSGPDLPWPEAKRTGRLRDNVVAFPTTESEEPDDKPEEASALPEEPEELPEEEAEILSFPEEESVLSAFIKDIGQKADEYADRMFEEDERTDPDAVRRLERLIPGTDREDVPPAGDIRRVRRPKRQAPPPPDTPPQELAKTYSHGLKSLRIRSLLVFLLAVLAGVQLAVPALGLVWPEPLDRMDIQRWTAVGLLAAGTLLSGDVLLRGLLQAFRLKVGMNTLCTLSTLFTLTDGILLSVYALQPRRLPYSAVVLAGQFLLLHGTYHERCALRLSCRTAAASSAPYRVTLDEGKWNGRDTYTKWSGTAEGFGSQIQTDNGAQQIFYRVCPLFLLAGMLLSVLATVGTGHPADLAWALSALFTVSASFGAPLVYSRPFHKAARRLAQSGAVLAGWPGIADSHRGDRVLITDHDLFPPGYVELNGYKVMSGYPAERVVAYTATLIRDSGSGLTRLFHNEVRALGGLMRNADRLCCYEGGGLSANIRGDQVLVGSAAFMNLMEIAIPRGTNVKSAVFCAINGDLAGIFALNYTLPDTVFPALEELIESGVGPVLATRDFNLIPAMLHQRFKLAANRMDFPPVERRRELSDPNQPHSGTLTALLCREGLFPLAESISAAKRLRRAARLGALLCCLGSALGLALCTYLVSVSAYTSLSPLSLLAYLLIWLAPVWFLTGWVHRF